MGQQNGAPRGADKTEGEVQADRQGDPAPERVRGQVQQPEADHEDQWEQQDAGDRGEIGEQIAQEAAVGVFQRVVAKLAEDAGNVRRVDRGEGKAAHNALAVQVQRVLEEIIMVLLADLDRKEHQAAEKEGVDPLAAEQLVFGQRR